MPYGNPRGRYNGGCRGREGGGCTAHEDTAAETAA